MNKIIVSKKNVIDLKCFLDNYMNRDVDVNTKLTHTVMEMYFRDKGWKPPKRVSFDKVNKEKILNGDYIAVSDETNRILIYENPMRVSDDKLLLELQRISSEELEIRRNKILNEMKEKSLVKKKTIKGD